MHNDKLQMISHPSGRGSQALLPSPSGRGSQALLPSPKGCESQALLPSPKGRGSQALLPSPPGRGAGGEGTTLATNCTQPEPSPQPSPRGRGSQDSALTRHPFLQADGSQTPAFRPRRS